MRSMSATLLTSSFFKIRCAMNLDGARTDAKSTADLLVGGAGDQLFKHIALTAV